MNREDEIGLIFGILVVVGSSYMVYQDIKYIWFGIGRIFDYFDANREIRESVNRKERIDETV